MSQRDQDGNGAARTRRFSIDDPFETHHHLRNARQQAEQRGLDQFTIVDADMHHYEDESWSELVSYVDDEVLRHAALSGGVTRPAAHLGMLPSEPANQDLSGRIARYSRRNTEGIDAVGAARDIEVARRVREAMAVDYQVIFPTPMLNLGLHPSTEIEVALARAYARWITENVLAKDDSVKTLLFLPFNEPDACVQLVEEFGDAPGVIGMMVTSVRHRPVHHRAYWPLYRMLEERGLPLGFHSSTNWMDRSAEQFNRFISMHALTFVWYNAVHLTNWVINGLPELFPKLDTLWIESGLAWVPFLMQRLDHEYSMRSSEAPRLQRMPSEYMRDMYYTSQPMEVPDDLRFLEATFDMIDARSQLLYASDYPHWDFDLPSRIYDLPFLDESAKRSILGGNACRLFGLPDRHPTAATALV
jgi:predicted TIM-barrel fold metal-dependent hydrolase